MRKYWVVVVDDDPVSLKNARELLNGDEIRISSVRSGKDLLLFITKNEPDLILLDVMMPEMDGFETFMKLREYENLEGKRHIPVIFLTGEEDSDFEQKGLRIGASDFIRKPINREIMIKRIQNSIANVEIINNLTEEAHTDKLTGFLNKEATVTKITELCNNNRGMLMVLDLDNFKLVNDLYGHDKGDEVLKIFAKVARDNCKSDDVLCRIGGDEFLAFFMNTVDENIAVSFTRRINAKLLEACNKMLGSEFNIPIGVSVGCVSVEPGEKYEEMFRLADKALYQVKRNGKHGCQFYDPALMNIDTSEKDVSKELSKMMLLCAERGKVENAMSVGQDSFIPIYRYLVRYAMRHNDLLTKLLFAIVPDETVAGEEYMEAVSVFGTILQESLRKNDVIMKNKSNFFFIILPEVEKINANVVINRIMDKWEKTSFSEHIKISYSFDCAQYKDE